MSDLTTRPRYSAPRPRPDMRSLWRFNDHRVEGNAAYLLLRDKDHQPCGEAIIDLWDLERAREAAHWRAHRVERGLLYARGTMRGPDAPRGQRKPGLYLHRFIVDAPDDRMVDHWDGNGLNCRRDNLRVVERPANTLNMHAYRRVRDLEAAMRDLLRCPHQGERCACKRRAMKLLEHAT